MANVPMVLTQPDPEATAPPDDDPNVTDLGWHVYGWSRGYLAFDQILTDDWSDSGPGLWTLITKTSHSTDGVHWQAGSDFNLTGSGDDEYAGASGYGGISGLVEGPAGLLAYSVLTPDCGTIYDSAVWPVAISPDGVGWQTVNADANGKTIDADLYGLAVGGGPAGYITAGKNGVFTSTDGLSWKATNLKSPAFSGFQAIEGGTSIVGGFVLSGETRFPDRSCTGDTPTQVTPSLWWSANGSTWTRAALPNPVHGPDFDTWVCRFGDRLLVAIATSGEQSREWVSTDGHSWKSIPVSNVAVCPKDDFMGGQYVGSVGGRTLVLAHTDADSSSIYLLHDDLTLTRLAQTGDVPPVRSQSGIFGPAGLIVTDDDGNVYLGVPIAG